jgi:hypothetical protein
MEQHELPVAGIYRGVHIYGLQSAARIELAKREIETVIAMADARRLCDFACDASGGPEARLLAKHKAAGKPRAAATAADRR